MKKISFIFPTFNEAKFIGETLDQFIPFRQKYNFELIVADGRSKDETIAVAGEHGADKIIIRRDEDPITISFARNMGGKAATGEILIWLDADMRIENFGKFINRVLMVFENPRVVGATVNTFIYPEEETMFDRMFWRFENLIIRSAYWIGLANARGECLVIRASTWKELGGINPKLVAREDFDMFLRLNRKGKVVFFKDINVFESPRRYRKLGYRNVIVEWFLNGFFYIFFKRSFSKAWKSIR